MRYNRWSAIQTNHRQAPRRENWNCKLEVRRNSPSKMNRFAGTDLNEGSFCAHVIEGIAPSAMNDADASRHREREIKPVHSPSRDRVRTTGCSCLERVWKTTCFVGARRSQHPSVLPKDTSASGEGFRDTRGSRKCAANMGEARDLGRSCRLCRLVIQPLARPIARRNDARCSASRIAPALSPVDSADSRAASMLGSSAWRRACHTAPSGPSRRGTA